MSKKWVFTGGAAVLVVAAIAAALFLTSRGTPSSPGGNVVKEATTTASSGTDASTTPAGGSGQASPATSTPASGKSSVSPIKLKPMPEVPMPKVPPKAPKATESTGEALGPLTSAPDMTISGLKLGSVTDGAEYRITMHPYGFGPSLALGSRLALHVDSVMPVQPTPDNDQIKNANILALMDTTNGGAVTKGGAYWATLTFRSDGTKLLPVLSKVSAK